MRLVIPIILLLLSQACAPVIRPMGPIQGAPSLTGNALIGRDGAILGRFTSGVAPEDAKLKDAIEAALKTAG